MAPTPSVPGSATRRRTRQAIVDAAATVLVRRRDATVADIAEAAGTSRSTVHRYFEDRSALVEAAVLDSVAAIVAATQAARVEAGEPAAAMRRLVAAYLDVGVRIRLLFEDPDLAREHPAVAELVSAEGPVLAMIRRGQADGVFDPSVSAEWLERVLWALLYTTVEAVDDGLLARHEALTTMLRTLEAGIGPRAQDDAPRA